MLHGFDINNSKIKFKSVVQAMNNPFPPPLPSSPSFLQIAISMLSLSGDSITLDIIFMHNYIYHLLLLALLALLGHPFILETTNQNTVYTTFVVRYPDTKLRNGLVYLRGDHCNLTWNKGLLLNHSATNQWKLVMLCPESLEINVKALLNDSIWMLGGNTVFHGGDRTIQLYPSFYPSANKVIDKSNIVSKILNNTRKCSIYYPPSYYDNTLKQYQVLLLHDGQNLFNNSQAAFGTAWLVQNTLNEMVSEGNMREIVVVGVWNTQDRNSQYTYSYDPEYKFGGKGDKYLDFLEEELIPVLDGDWFKGRIKKGGYGIGGSSLGGLISCYAAYTRPQRFKTAICMSSSFWWNNQDFNHYVLNGQKHYNDVAFYLDSGDSGSSQDGKNQTIAVYDRLTKIGYKQNQSLFYYLDKGGEHSEHYWGRRFFVPMAYLYP